MSPDKELGAATNPVATLALQKPRVSGRLEKGADFLDQGSVLQHLSDIARGHDLDRHVDRRTLLTWAPIFMEASNGQDDYRDSAAKDKRNAGATARELDALYDAVYGHDMAFDTRNKSTWMDRIRSELAQGQSVLAGIKYGSGGHQLLVTGLQKHQGTEDVKYINPWGQHERMGRRGVPLADERPQLRHAPGPGAPPGEPRVPRRVSRREALPADPWKPPRRGPRPSARARCSRTARGSCRSQSPGLPCAG
ncbi:hypothetical protein [Archangium primigenium]|uniref:hypothetical protein n=1 Tax=[Archangium] primigenium TaxID=2792470 RepID=UPI0019565BAB|nr:hypothetical protein [Archangium primigenium]MBM7113618.1 hypothetical protein [Archangium primigenium]